MKRSSKKKKRNRSPKPQSKKSRAGLDRKAAQVSDQAKSGVEDSVKLFRRAHAVDEKADDVHHAIEGLHETIHEMHAPAAGRPGEPVIVTEEPASNGSPFTIVGVGASAGGFEAFSDFLTHFPKGTGMAMVLVQHLDPKYKSQLSELLGRSTRIPVLEARHDMEVQPEHIYVIPENTSITISGGRLKLAKRKDRETTHMPIDVFLRSLATEQRERAIGVVLSGTGSDGTIGLEAIKGEGGITFAQDEKSAKQYGMPGNAMNSGAVDFVMSPAEIARELARIARHPYLEKPKRQAKAAEDNASEKALENPQAMGRSSACCVPALAWISRFTSNPRSSAASSAAWCCTSSIRCPHTSKWRRPSRPNSTPCSTTC